ncbi:putative toxin-antitoxin system toxin component, PIN family [Mucilaginibacter sp. Mucisp84]|uniref:putative toxin-antitoxin system toxin component, PIN family n=1 Tax=Mucilaginibacter sp. Mucisp84 TaxID=3243058 RepID=UPI0039A60DA1
MPNNIIKVILDTNLWISFLIRKDYSKLDALLFSGRIRLIFSKELLQEFLDVARRPKFRRYFSSIDILDIIETIEEFAEFIEVQISVKACRDEKDNFLLALAVDSKASYLLTGDLDLLELKSYHHTIITTIADFFELSIS